MSTAEERLASLVDAVARNEQEAATVVVCNRCGGTGTVRAFATQGTPCEECDGLGMVEAIPLPSRPMTIDGAIDAEAQQMIEPGDKPTIRRRRRKG